MTTFRLTDDDLEMLQLIQDTYNLNKTEALRMLIYDRYNYLVAHSGDKNMDFKDTFDTALQEFYDKVTDAFDEMKDK